MVTAKKLIFVLIPIVIIAGQQGCECLVQPPCYGGINFILRSKVTKFDLVQGPYSIYNIDSIKVYSGGHNDSLGYGGRLEPISGTQLSYSLFDPSDTLFFKLNATDTDTLLISFKNLKRNLCCSSGMKEVTGVAYNGVKAMQEYSAYIFEK